MAIVKILDISKYWTFHSCILEMETILIMGQAVYREGTNCSNTFVGIPYLDWHNLKEDESLNEFLNDAHDELQGTLTGFVQ